MSTGDTLASLPEKRCAEFMLDAGYYEKTFPSRKLRSMPVVNMTAGMFFPGSAGAGDLSQRMKWLGRWRPPRVRSAMPVSASLKPAI